MADQVLVGIAQRVGIGGELRQSFGDLLDDLAESVVAGLVCLAQLLRTQIDLREQPGEGAFERFVLDVLETLLQRVQQFPVLGPGHVGDIRPQMLWLDDVVCLAAHLLFERGDVAGVVVVPDRQRRSAAIAHRIRGGIVPPQLLLRGLLVIVRKIAQEQKREHVITEVVRVHRAAQLVGDVPEGFAELFLVVFGHGFSSPGSVEPSRIP